MENKKLTPEEFINFIADDNQALNESKIVLSKLTSTSSREVKDHAGFAFSKRVYKNFETKSSALKAVATIINATITQNREYFIITRRSLSRMLRKDPNHPASIKISGSTYSKVIQLLIQKNIAMMHKMGGRKQATIFRASDNLQTYLRPRDSEAQRIEAESFVKYQLETNPEITLVQQTPAQKSHPITSRPDSSANHTPAVKRTTLPCNAITPKTAHSPQTKEKLILDLLPQATLPTECVISPKQPNKDILDSFDKMSEQDLQNFVEQESLRIA